MVKYFKIISMMFIIILFVVSNSCDKLFPDDKLSLHQTPYTGSELRIDGYYYNYFEGWRINTHFFYANGIIRYGGGGSSSFQEFEERIKNSTILPGDTKTEWGVFIVNNDIIKFEKWYPSSGGGAPAYVREGRILNDTTFHITISYRSNGSERRIKDEIYHFKQYSPKPDSTNEFIP
jgi:hypothetical protein